MARISMLALLFYFVSPSFAFEVGDTVVVVHEAQLKVGEKVGDDVWPGLDLKIIAVKGNWLWVSNGHPGWLEQKHVVAPDQAIPALSDLILKNPSHSEYFNGRGLVWRSRNEPDLAINDFDNAIRLKTQASVYSNRGNVWSDKGQFDKAIADYTDSIRLELNPVTKAQIYNNRGVAQELAGDIDKAVSDYSDAIQLDSKYVVAFTNRAECLLKKKEYEGAIRDCDEVLKLDENVLYARWIRAEAWLKTSEFGKAKSDFELVVSLDPKSGKYCDRLAWLLATCPIDTVRDGEKAVEYANKACEFTGWKSWTYITTLAAAYAELGDFDKAVDWQVKAMVAAPAIARVDLNQRLTQYIKKSPFRD